MGASVHIQEPVRPLTPDELSKLDQAQRAYEEAKYHKAMRQQHQRKGKRAMVLFDSFRADLEKRGIRVIIDHPSATHVQEDTSDRSSRSD